MRKNKLILGFSSGTVKKAVNPISNEMLQLFLDAGSNAVELSLSPIERIAWLLNLDLSLLKKFDYVSIHMPKVQYKNDEITKEVITKVNAFTKKTPIKLLVFHPDCIKDWNILENFNTPVAIENMDKSKKTGKTVEELKIILKEHAFGFVLDVNHASSIDPSMKLKQEFLDAFRDRLVEIHASGYSNEFIHMPLSETMQSFLLKQLPKNMPIILESTMHNGVNLKKIKQEMEYVKRHLSSS